MAIKYISIPEEKKTIAVIHHTEDAAIDRINNVLGGTQTLFFDPEKYKMKNSYKATVICRDGDEYSEERGKEEAKKKVLKHYYTALDKKCDAFIEDLNTAMFRAVCKFSKRVEDEE